MLSPLPGIQLKTETRLSSPFMAETAVPLFTGYISGLEAEKLHPVSGVEPEYGTGVLAQTLQHYFSSGGQAAYVFSLGEWSGNNVRLEDALQSVALRQALGAEPAITLLACPDMTRLEDGDTQRWCAVWQQLTNLSQTRPGLFAVFDTPDDARQAQQVLQQFAKQGTERAAAYWPRLYTDGEAGKRMAVPACGAVVAAMQQTDRQYGVWRAPANAALPQVIGPVHNAIEYEHLFELQDVSCNLIRSFPVRGTRIWGCQTLAGKRHATFRYIQTRRLVDYVERRLTQLARMYLFEPNNALTWYKIKGQFHNWLRRLWQQGGLSGGQENEAFSISLGLDETMTQDDIHAGKMIVKVRIAPLSPAEFIDITLELNTRSSHAPDIATTEISHDR